MSNSTTLTGAHLRTYKAIFQHPASHNISWQDIHALFREMGSVVQEPNGSLKVTRNGKAMILQPTSDKQVETTDEIVSLRHFLAGSETLEVTDDKPAHDWLLVIDHHEARIFRSEMSGSVPQQIAPQDPEHYFRHAHNSREFTRGKEKPEPNSFFEPVTRALAGARRILIFGTGTGTSSEMDQYVAWVKEHHADVAKRIIGSVKIDSHHITEAELLAKARAFYRNALPAQS